MKITKQEFLEVCKNLLKILLSVILLLIVVIPTILLIGVLISKISTMFPLFGWLLGGLVIIYLIWDLFTTELAFIRTRKACDEMWKEFNKNGKL